MFEIKGKYGKALITIDSIEDTALNQIYNMINHPAFTENIVIMPDAHAGSGSCVGFTMPLTNKIVPSVVGVDIACGVLCANIGNKIPMKLDRLDTLIKREIPMGNKTHQSPVIDFIKEYKWDLANDMANKFISKYNDKFKTSYKSKIFNYDYFLDLINKVGSKNALESIGTLGGGNHFISIEKSENNGDNWILIHSGSRNLGKLVCEYHQKISKKILQNKRTYDLKEKIKDIVSNTKNPKVIPCLIEKAKKDLGILFKGVDINGMEYLEEQESIDYLMDMIFMYFYADLNRSTMLNIIINILNIEVKEIIHSVHNYIDFKDMIIRKGAISSYEDNKLILPLNMKDGSIICVGKSNEFFNFSSPHGAGRIMSRGEANRKLDLEKFKRTMDGIYSTSVNKDTLDESPMAYKKPDFIENSIKDMVIILDKIKPILNIKSSESNNFKEIRNIEKNKKIKIDSDDFIINKKFRKNKKELRNIRGKF